MTNEVEFAARSQLKWARESDAWILLYRRRRMDAHRLRQKLRHDARLGGTCYCVESRSRFDWPQRKAQMPAAVSKRRFPPVWEVD
jgi:hypothetical protein